MKLPVSWSAGTYPLSYHLAQRPETSIEIKWFRNYLEERNTGTGNSYNQGGKRLGDETSVSEQKGVMQWTGIELAARPKFKIRRSKFKILTIY